MCGVEIAEDAILNSQVPGLDTYTNRSFLDPTAISDLLAQNVSPFIQPTSHLPVYTPLIPTPHSPVHSNPRIRNPTYSLVLSVYSMRLHYADLGV